MSDITEFYNCQYIRVICPHKMLKTVSSTKDLNEITRFIYPELNYSNPQLRLLIIYGSHNLPLYIFKSTLPAERGLMSTCGRNSPPRKNNQTNKIHIINLVYTDPFYEHNDIKTISRSHVNLILQWNNRVILNYCSRTKTRLQDVKHTTLLYINKIVEGYLDHPNGCDFCRYECCIKGIHSPCRVNSDSLHDSYKEIGYLPDFHEKLMMYDAEVLDPKIKNIQFDNKYLYTYSFKYDEDFRLVKMDRSLKKYVY